MFAVPVLAPEIGARLDLDPAFVGPFMAALNVFSSWAAAAGGAAAARHGGIPVAATSLTLATLGALSAASGSLIGLILALAAFGLAAGAEMPAGSHLLARLIPPARQARWFSIRQTGAQIGGVVGSLTLPWLAMSGAAFAHCAMQICLNSMTATYAVLDLGMSLPVAGMLLATAQAGGMIGRVGWGLVAERIGAARPVLMGIGLTMAFATGLVALFATGWPRPAMFAVMFMFGATASGWNGIFLAEIVRLAPEGRAAEVTGGSQFIAFLGLITGPLLFGAVAEFTGQRGLGFVAIGALALVGTALLVRAKPTT